ncbi:MAG: hypothetical protein ACOYNU_15265, partial [Bacteroidales bacterium]
MKKQLSKYNEVDEIMSLSTYAYIEYKASRFLEKGILKYTENDAFNQPGYELSTEIIALLRSGCEQIRNRKGLTRELPFEGLGIAGFYRLMRMFHFDPVQQQTSLINENFITD